MLWPVLYSFRRCPYAMRARLALHAAGVACELREVDLKGKPQALLLASPKGTVPVLVLGDGSVIDESLGIMQWALALRDPEAWTPREQERAQCDALIAHCDSEFKSHLDRYKYPHRFGLADGSVHRDAACTWLHMLDEVLRTQTSLVARGFGLADAAILPFVRQFAHTDAGWFAAQAWPALQRWLAHFESSARFDTVMQRHTVWQPENTAAVWPDAGLRITCRNQIMSS